ncbi:MAG: hypothetical protein Q7U12_08405 [Undibacterium sp.]|nr:hypothetical protein [Undibacterium sp.]
MACKAQGCCVFLNDVFLDVIYWIKCIAETTFQTAILFFQARCIVCMIIKNILISKTVTEVVTAAINVVQRVGEGVVLRLQKTNCWRTVSQAFQ